MILFLYDYTTKRFLDVIYKGQFTKVYLAKRNDEQKKDKYVVKVYSKVDVKSTILSKRIMLERKIMARASKYPEYFSRLRCSFSTNEHLFVVMDYEPFGDCLSLLQRLQ